MLVGRAEARVAGSDGTQHIWGEEQQNSTETLRTSWTGTEKTVVRAQARFKVSVWRVASLMGGLPNGLKSVRNSGREETDRQKSYALVAGVSVRRKERSLEQMETV